MQKRKSFFNNELEQRFSLRKYTIGLCSVCLGFVAIGMGSQTVKADTVNDVEKSSAVQENKAQDTNLPNTDALAEAKTNTSDSAATKPNTTPTETKENGAGSVAMAAPKTNAASTGANANIVDSATPTETKLNKANPAAANSNNALAQSKLTKTELIAQPKVGGTSTGTKPNELGSTAANPNAVSTEVKPGTANPASLAKIKPQRIRLAKLADTKALAESKVATDNQINCDGWETEVDGNYLNITGYFPGGFWNKSKPKQLVVPNGADFAKAGKNDKNLPVEIDKDTLADLISNDGIAPKLSNTDGQKIVAKGTDWSDAFNKSHLDYLGKHLYDISGLANLDTSNITDMSYMFKGNRISDLSSLANWNTGNVTDMSSMFEGNRISDLSPLANWNTGNVTDMRGMFNTNQISDLSPLANWNTGNVTDIGAMFYYNQISDLSPLANWNTGNVTLMHNMFLSNRISDLSPLANWNTGNVTNMYGMFHENQISNLNPLANWNTGNVTSMDEMFEENPLNIAINSQSILNKFHASIYKLDNTGTLASHSESKTFNDGSQILLDKNVVTNKDSATLTFKANSSTGNTYQIKIYNPDESINIQAAALPTALGTTDTSYQDGYTIITNKFINNGSVSQDISITQHNYHDTPAFAQYESTSGLITVVKDKNDLGSINITYQNVSGISNHISAPYIGNKPYINHTQNTFYFQPQINRDYPNDQYSFIKSAGLTITVPDEVTIDPDTFIDNATGKILKATKIADHQYQVVLNNTTDKIAVKGLINVPADKLANGTAHLSGFGMKYTIHTYNDKVAPLVTTGTSKELSVIPDLASYHGDLININQSKWAFDRKGHEVYNYTSQGFTNNFNGLPLEPVVSTQITNGVETFDIPDGVYISKFTPPFNNDVIDHIDYTYIDGSPERVPSFDVTSDYPSNYDIDQIKIYFKNGIQSDNLFDSNSYPKLRLGSGSFYASSKDFDTFKITGSFSCDELGSTGNVDVAQVMLAPTQKLTDGMLTDTSQDESNKAPNANGNSISAIISNDGLQHQGHLINPIFYFKYNDLMVPDLSEISARYDNQYYIDDDKIHSSIITDGTGQKFIKVQVDGEYYYSSSSNRKSDFNVKIPISNTPDALSATKDWSWYILNNNDEAKTESVIRNSGQDNKPSPVTIDGNTLSVGGKGTWQIIVAQGFTSGTETQGNLNGGPGLASTQDDHQQDPTHFNIYDSIINATNDAKSDLVSVANLPSTQDGKSQFNVHMTGKASLINVMTGQIYDATITYSYGTGDNNFITGDQVTDWSKVKSIKVVPNGGAPSMTSLRLVVPVEDKTIYDDVGKTIYMSTMTYGEDKTNTDYTTKDGFAVPKKSAILPIIIKPGDAASAKLTVRGQATVHTLIHYKDENGKDVYVKLPDQDRTYNELQDTMRRRDYLQPDSYLSVADHKLIPKGMVINYNNPTIRNSNNTYAAGYANGTAAFDKTAKYDFDGDQVIFEGKMPEIVTKTHQVKETIHYVYRDGSTAKPDKVLTSITLKQMGYKNPFTGEITWNTSTTDTLNSVDSPEITGYIADRSVVPSYVVTMDSPDKEVTVTYDVDNENADFTYIDDTTQSTLKTVNKSGKSNTSIGYTTTDEINNYEKQGYTLVSDDTDGRNLNFDSLPTVDQHYMIHLKHKTERVTGNGTVTRTIHYLYDNGNTAKPDKTQTVSFNETGTKDDVTGKTTWDNDDAQTVDSVTTPSITGYTPDKLSIDKQTFNFGDKDVEVTVRYNANMQNAKIIYVDDTTKTNLKSKDTSGKFGQTITFETTPADEIENYKKQGYVLVSNTFDNNKYQVDNSSNVFYVHLKHDTKNVSRNDDINMTVHYVMDDNSEAPSDNKQTLSFTENGIQDLVTKKIDWTSAESQTFKDVATPKVTGYTPDKDKVAGQTVNFGDKDIEATVKYTANTQTATITYIDDTTKTNLKSKDTSGKFGQAITFETAPTDEIANYEKQGYVLVSNSFDNNKYQADNSSNVFYVHLKHKIENVTRNDTVTRTIHYLYDNGDTAQPDKTQTVSFNETGTKDDVTNNTTWDNDDAQTVDSVITPSITGYTPDKSSIEKQSFKFGDQDVEVTVTYNANAQTATITYIDDTDKKTLGSDSQNGKFNQAITFEHDPVAKIASYENQGYVFVSNSFNNNKYQADNGSNIFYVHLKHGTKKVSRNDDVNMTVHYVMDDNSEAPSDNKQTVNFTENGIQDLVTKHIDWTPANSQTFKDVATKSIVGYTPDKENVAGQTVNFGDNDINVTVTYHANAQTATITYIDDTTKNNLDSKDASGKFGQAITFETAPADEIANYKKQGYVLVSNSFDNNKYQADNSSNVFYVHLKHDTKNVSRDSNVNMTVHYVMDDNSEAPSDNKQTLSFTENGIQDLVTKHIDWTPAVSQTFKDVATKSIVGYTPDKENVAGQTVNFGDNDINVTVHYNANTQNAKIIYIDDTTKTDLDSKDTSGKFGQAITFETAPADKIENYKKQGYKLVSNDFNDNKYQADNSKNVFHVHFVHDTKKVSRNDDVKMTIHYVMDDGSVAPSDSKQTVNFTEDGTQDLVTKHIDWTPAVSQTFKDVATKSIVGYTPDKENVAGQTVNFGDSDINVTVHYNANTQNAKIIYIDDTTKTNLKSKETSGKFGQAITFETTPADEIENYKKQGYVLVSSTFDNNKYQADNSSNIFYVHLKHDTKDVSRNDDVKMTVHYVMDDNSEAPSDNKQSLSFTENGIQDLVTKHIDWTPAVSQTFKDVDSPVLTGYTADIKTANGKVVNFGDNDINVTVHYSANTQTATITYIDDTEKKTLGSDNQNGKFNQVIAFEHDPAEVIKGFEEKGYVFVSNSFDHQKYQADNSNNVFKVHFVHGTKDVSRSDDVNMTVHYVMDDNSEAPSDNKQSLSFTENGIQDLVTQTITWTPAASQTFKDVVTPKVAGYTPDQDKVAGQTVNFGDKDAEVTVTYSPNVQIGHINYIDDDTKKTLTRDDFSGRTNEHEDYTSTDRIQEFENKGYELVSNDYPEGGFNFDNNDRQDQVFNVHFKHGTVTVTTKNPQTPNTPINPDPQSPKYPKDINNTNKDVKRTIDYKFKDDKTAQPTVTDSLHFERTVVIDKVTGKVSSDTWTQSQNFSDIQTPAIQGYTPDRTAVSDKNIGHDHQDIIEHVVYSPDAQHMTITYIDDTTSKKLHTDKLNGVSDQDAKYTTSDTIKQYEEKHYKLVSDSTKGQDLIFDHDDNVNQTYEVHFVHGKHAINQTTSPKQTIHYVYVNGLTRQGKVADDNVQQLSFKRDGYNDEVTGIDHWNAWTPANSQYEAVDSPVIQGYTPDKLVVEKSTVNPTDKDTEITVAYNADKQHMTITYIDDTTGETLHTDNPNGVSDQDTKYTTSDTIKQYEDQHYKLVSDSTKGQDLIFDHDDNADQTYEVHFVHGKHAIDQTTSPKQTIHYVYANGLARQGKVADDNVQQLSFKRDGYNDEVTGIDHWNAWTPVNSQYEAVDSPVIQGYTPDKLVVEKSTVNPTDKDTEVTVTYSADKQAARVIYVDKTTNTTLVSKDLSGNSDKDSEYNTGDKIGQYKSQHYVLFEDETNGKNVVFDHDDQQDQTYYVYFVHDTQKVNRQDTVTSTIDYKFEDGKTAQPTVTQTKYFSENGIKDLVTNKITWDEAKPQKFEDVATKSIVGYTPDKDNVVGSTVNFGDKDITETVIYHNNVQKAVITYVDDMTNQALTSDSQDGKFDHEVKFNNNPSDVISGFEKSGYKLVSSNFKDGTKYKADNKQNEFIVHLTHNMQSVSRQDKVIETIHYVYENGSKSQPDHKQTISFNETGSKDLVTGKITWDEAKPQKFEDVVTPKMTGYTPDKDSVAGGIVKFGDQDAEVTVRYIANVQTATITYIDDTEKKALNSDKQNGKFNQVITFEHDPAEAIKGLEEKGYKLISDNFKPGIKYQSDNKSNNFEVHLVHTYEPAETSQTITETVHYIDANNKPVAPDHVATVVVKVTGTRDKVTNSITWNTPSTGHFDEVMSPAVPNMTPDKKFIPGRDVRYGDSDITESVVYTLDEMPGEPGKSNKPGDSTPKTPENPNKPGDSTPKTPGKSNKPGDSTPKTPGKSNKPGDSTPKIPGKSNKSGDSTPKTPKKPNKPGNSIAKTPEKSNKSGKEVSKQHGMITETTIPKKHVDSRTADNQASAKSTAKRELPQTGATTSAGVWAGLASMIASLGLLGASKKRKKN